MKITELHPPVNNVPDIPATDGKGNRFILRDLSSDFFGMAVSTKGRKYRFCADIEGAFAVFREERGGQFWKQIKSPSALSKVAAEAVRSALEGGGHGE